jgi:hypothetical protein
VVWLAALSVAAGRVLVGVAVGLAAAAAIGCPPSQDVELGG